MRCARSLRFPLLALLLFPFFTPARGQPSNGTAALSSGMRLDTPAYIPAQPMEASGLSAEDAELAAAHESTHPTLVDAATRKYERQLYHLAPSTGVLTVINYGFVLQPNVVQLAHGHGAQITSTACYARGGENGTEASWSLLLTLRNANESVGTDLFRPGNLLLNDSTLSCYEGDGDADDVAVQYRIVQAGSPFLVSTKAGLRVNVTVVAETNQSSFIASSAFTFYRGNISRYVERVASKRTMALHNHNATFQAYLQSRGGGTRRLLYDVSSDQVFTQTLFTLTSRQVYSGNGLTLTCNSCYLQGGIEIFASADHTSSSASVATSGYLTLHADITLQISSGWTTNGDFRQAVLSLQCLWPICWGVNLWGLGGFQIGLQVGLDSVTNYVVYFTATISFISETTVYAEPWAEYSNGAVSSGFTTFVSDHQVLSSPLYDATSITSKSGWAPKLQVGIWGNVNVWIAGASANIYGEGDFDVYLQLSASYTSTQFSTTPPSAYNGLAGCSAAVQDTRLLIVAGVDHIQLVFNVAASLYVCCWPFDWSWNPSYAHTWTFTDNPPLTLWGVCLRLNSSPPPPFPPPRPPPPSPPQALVSSVPAFTVSGSCGLFCGSFYQILTGPLASSTCVSSGPTYVLGSGLVTSASYVVYAAANYSYWVVSNDGTVSSCSTGAYCYAYPAAFNSTLSSLRSISSWYCWSGSAWSATAMILGGFASPPPSPPRPPPPPKPPAPPPPKPPSPPTGTTFTPPPRPPQPKPPPPRPPPPKPTTSG